MLKTTNQPTSGCYFKMLVSMFFASLIYFSRTIEIKNKFGLFKYFNDLLLVTGKKWKELINLVIEKEAENTVLDQGCELELVAKFLKEEEKKVVKLSLPRFC